MTRLLRKKDLSSPMSEFLSTIVLICVMWFGGQLVLGAESHLSPEEFIGYIVIFSQIIPPVKSFTSAFYHIQKGSASAKRVCEILDEVNPIQDPAHPKGKGVLQEGIQFQNVSFSYEQKEVLTKIQLDIKKGETVALVGQSGSGKSTIADLLARFYDIQQGEILIDSINIKDYKIADLRAMMGIVSQDAILFNDSVINNICLGKTKATKEEVIAAAKTANAHDFIMQMEKGYSSNIGEGGNKLSGGQKQRLSIARAILKNPDILILDEATSALDMESENLVKDALQKLMQKRTSLVIAHRLSTIQHANKIVVLHEGKIKESGTHQELLNKKGAYHKLFELQSFE
tara:strand:- start:3624 stop:4655 length:1032 start_codon:yes stop_codon:yes gene_type:complete